RVRLEGVPVLDPGRVARTPRRQLLVFEVREHGLVRLAGTERVHGSRPYSTEPDCLKRPDVPWGRRRLLREPLPVCVADRLRAVADADLREEVVDVALDGRLADEQALGDLAVAQTLCDEHEHLRLAWRQAVGELGSSGDRVDQ